MTSNRQFDVVVWGATGYTGKWVAKHLFDQYSNRSLRWAIAGRNPDKMEEVREFVGDELGEVTGILADSLDEGSLIDLVQSTKVIISTVGPYAYYGSNLIKACVEHGTHYVDLCGEVPWIREMIDTHTTAAEKSGACIVHSCGFDSIPSDMGTYYIQEQAKKKYKSYLSSVHFALIKMRGGVSGGTIESMMNVMQDVVRDKQTRQLMLNPYALNPDPDFEGNDGLDQMTAKYRAELNSWTAPFVMSAINSRIVRRSNALLGFRWGKNFSYSESMATGNGVLGLAAATSIATAIAGFGTVALTSVGRKALGLVLPSPGKGSGTVNPEKPGSYTIDFHGKTAKGEKLVARVTGDSDPGYGSTSKMLAESAICLAKDEKKIKVGGGFWTPASAMGDALLKRLEKNAGLSFELVEKDD